jgi:hypothetical protein
MGIQLAGKFGKEAVLRGVSVRAKGPRSPNRG